jgi:vitamin B12 transporter
VLTGNHKILRFPALVFLACCCFPPELSAQLTDTLSEFQLKRSKKEQLSADERLNTYSPGQKVVTIDSATLERYHNQSIANLLTQRVPVFIRSYGFNGLATLNFRGSSAAQSAVYWNGVPIQNASLGLSDISMLPVAMTDRLSIVYGGSSALWGSGNVGGALLLESGQPHFDSISSKRLQLSVGAGSFSQYQAGVKTALSSRKWYFSGNVFAQSSRSDFVYRDENGKDRVNNNSGLKGLAAQAMGAYLSDNGDIWNLAAWVQHYERQIPAALFEKDSRKQQNDASLRLMAGWKRKRTVGELYIRSAFMLDHMAYTDPAIKLRTINDTRQAYLEAGLSRTIGMQHKVLLFIPMQYSWMEVSGSDKHREDYAVALSYAYHDLNEKLNIAASLRTALVNDQGVILPGLNGSYRLSNWLTARANVQRTYRAPTLNELYYDPGGNKDLRPEQGWSADAGYKLNINLFRSVTLTHDLSAFNRLIDDWIIWFGGAIVTPHNIASVRSRGLETENMLTIPIGKLGVHAGLNTAYVIATTVSSYAPNDGSIGKQIPYSPRYNGQINVGLTWKSLYFNYNQGYTGYRFTNTDESEYLDPYTVANIQVVYYYVLKSKSLSLSISCNNIFSQEYQVIAGRPMPGANWLLSLALHVK